MVLILLLCAMRVPTFTLMVTIDDYADQIYFWILFNAAALFFLTLFSELVLFWASLHDAMRPSALDGVGQRRRRLSTPQRRVFQVTVLIVAWATYAGLLFLGPTTAIFKQIVAYVTCGFFLVAAAFFTVYGLLLYNRIVELPLRSPRITSRIRRVLATAILMSVAFFFRAGKRGRESWRQ